MSKKDQILRPTTVMLGKYRNRTESRNGFVDRNGLVFLPPTSPKALEAWKTEMEHRWYTFGDSVE